MDVKKRMCLTGGLMKVVASDCKDVDEVLEEKDAETFSEILSKLKDEYFPLTLTELTAKERDYLCSPVVDCLFKAEQATFEPWVRELAKGGHLDMIQFIYKKWRFKYEESMLYRVGNHIKVIKWFKDTFGDEVCPYAILEQNVHLLTPESFEAILKLFAILAPGRTFTLSALLNLVLFEHILVQHGPWHVSSGIFNARYQKNFTDAFTILSKYPEKVSSIRYDRKLSEVHPKLLVPLVDKFSVRINIRRHVFGIITGNEHHITLWSEGGARAAVQAGWSEKTLWRHARSPEVFEYLTDVCEVDVTEIENASLQFARWTVRKHPKTMPTASFHYMDIVSWMVVEDTFDVYEKHFGLSKISRHSCYFANRTRHLKVAKRKMYE